MIDKKSPNKNFGDTTYRISSQQSIVGLQQSEDYCFDMTDDEREEN